MKVRFAPSPTGGFHPGNARVAIFNYLFSKKYKAKYVLRIEDTDLERSTKEYEEAIINDLKWLGIVWDEGPFRQSERIDIYEKYKKKLSDFLYKCYCTEEELKKERDEQIENHQPPKYSRKCLNVKDKSSEYTLRFNVEKFIEFNKSNFLSFEDEIKGEISYDIASVSDFILFKKDGMPTYNMAVVADDIDMGITHVFRGEDHISNTFRQLMIFKVLSAKEPSFGHLPILLSSERTKLSKRNGGVPIHELRQKGFLSQAVFNHLALLGGSIRNVNESSTINELVKNFDYKKTAVSPSVYDLEKLQSINTQIIGNTDSEKILNILNIDYKGYYTKKEILEIINLCKDGTRTLIDIENNLSIFVNNTFEDYCFKEKEINLLSFINTYINNLEKISWPELKEEIMKNTDLKGGKLFKFLRFLFTGKKNGPPLEEIMNIISINILKERVSNIIKNV